MFNEDKELCAAYTTHLRGEHRKLGACLRGVEQQFEADPKRGGRRRGAKAQMLASLTDLRQVLARHLAEEESGGCLEEALIRAPQFSRAALQLEHEDRDLLAQLDDLLNRLKIPRKPLRTMEQDCRRLVQRIREHVATESRIVEESFGIVGNG
jgi:hypothetical protein